ncbi:Neprosin [Dillenia turbinata]|uniref:Neprosin n=1 Tax=Dillenia turbinata TaxID=194707 RepID=A0AAN8ZRG6_9MAGN
MPCRQTSETECFNTQCPSFVPTRPDFPPGYVFQNVSKYGGVKFVEEFKLYKDPINKNWFLERGKYRIGFWKSSVFKRLADFGNYAEWGGETYDPKNEAGPAMGFGYPEAWPTSKNAYIKILKVVNEYQEFVDAVNTQEEVIGEGYWVTDKGNRRDKFRHWLKFGGSGQVS